MFSRILSICILLIAAQAISEPNRGSSFSVDPVPIPSEPGGVLSLQDNPTTYQTVGCCTFTFRATSFPDGSPAVEVVKECQTVLSADGTCPSGSAPDDGSGGGTSTTPQSTSSSESSSMNPTSTTSTTQAPNSSSTPISISLTSASSTAAPITSSTSSTISLSTGESTATSSFPTPATSLTFPFTTDTPTPSIVSATPPVESAAAADSNLSTSSSSSALPKIIGAFAGVSIVFLIIGATVGYLKQKKMKREETPILWPDTR